MKRALLSILAVVCISAIAIISCEEVSIGSIVKTEPSSSPRSIMKVDGAATLFTGKEDHYISVQAAEEMMTAFQSNNPFETYGWYFGREAIEWLLAQDGAVGIRIYGGFTPNGQFSPTILGVDAQGNDIVIYRDGVQAAKEMMTAFQSNNPFETYGWYFGREAIERLLAQDGAVGLRIYGGFKPTGQFSPVILGVDAQHNDIDGGGLHKSLSDSTNSTLRLEESFPCPPC